MSIDANALLMGGGIKAAKFDVMGATVVGTITEPPKAQQMKKYQTDELDFWPSGDPKMQIVVVLQTDQRDPSDADDDGKRNLFIVPRMMPPVRDAVRKTGAPGLEVGGRLAVQWTSGSGEGKGNPKEWAADYARPAMDPGALLAGAPAAAAPTPAAAPPMAAPVVQAAPPPVVQQQPLSPSVLGTPMGDTPPFGIDPTAWAALPDMQKAAIRAAMATPAAAPGF